MELATNFNAFAPVRHEPFALRLVYKGNGRRWVHDFGPRRRMHQKLVADILRQIHPPRRAQTLFNGGMPVARMAIAAAYRDGGFTHGVEVDIVRFYDSVRHPALADLLRPLPTPVVEHVVWDVAMRDDPSPYAVIGTMPAPTPSVLTGLSLGSATSPIVGEKIVAELLARAGETETITYADNLFVMGRSHGEVLARIDRIRESVTSWSDVGSLGLREGASFGYDLTQPFEFLRQEGVATGHGLEWRPGAEQRARYQLGDSEQHLTAEQIAAAEQRVRHWRRSYGDWPEGDAQEAIYLAELAARRFYNDGNASNRTAAVHAVIVAWLATGQDRDWWELLPDGGNASDNRRRALVEELRRWIAAALAGTSVAA
ncbi:Reverse transcriptase (RNA-dependent DNA polymerase) [Sphingomonas jatrophae]|uniref:Reverse transcriptase (RNA-dependent DNA polymerase) n=2 Tax=Sphingomonas jatrophae TaxID=1166337 RepID=A0A1I6JRE0_9SPHN|nr:Reverse transcriptase (RNA-dependent DNA polymerase) [Sphingomonas jatrophae]